MTRRKDPGSLNLEASRILITVVQSRWLPWLRAVQGTLPDGYPGSSDSGFSGGIGDPTGGAVLARDGLTDRIDEATELTRQLVGVLKRLDGIISDTQRQVLPVDIQRELAYERCSGEVDPTCVRNSVNGRGGLCFACYQRKRRGAA